MKLRYEEFDVSGVRTYPLASRRSKANAADFARPCPADASVAAWLETLPDILAGADFKAIVAALRRARAGDRAIVWGLGAHVIKTGLGPVLVDLMERGFVSAIAINGRRSSTTSRSRSRARRQRKSRNRSAPATSAWPRRPDGS